VVERRVRAGRNEPEPGFVRDLDYLDVRHDVQLYGTAAGSGALARLGATSG
jgi:hypothetical protein